MQTIILPPGGQFHAIVNGKHTGLAGCTRAQECPRAHCCIRTDSRLPYRVDMAYRQPAADCRAFIPVGA